MNINILHESQQNFTEVKDLLVYRWYRDDEADVWYVISQDPGEGECKVILYTKDNIEIATFYYDNTYLLTPIEVDLTIQTRPINPT